MKNFFTLILLFAVVFAVDAQQEFSKKDLALFANENLTQLKKNAKAKKVAKMQSPELMQVAQSMLDKSYKVDERFKSYECYLSPRKLSEIQKTSGYSQYENPTGIFFENGDKAILWVGSLNGAEVSLIVQNWGPPVEEGDKKKRGHRSGDNVYKLSEGINVLDIENGGNSYIQYFSQEMPADHYRNNLSYTPTSNVVPNVEVHILTGKVNGVFDLAKDDNKRWNQLLNEAVSPVMDIMGRQTQLIYSIGSLKREAYGKGVELIALYDTLISQQHQIMGLVKYNRVPKNHMLGRVIWNGFMHADGLGAAFHDDTMRDLANVEKLRKNSWGVAHEFGHVNQVRPTMKWVGTTEVSNNIFSVWSQYFYNTDSPKLEREVLSDYDGLKIGGRVTAYMQSAFVHRQPWLTQAGNDRWDRERPRDWGGDHFVKLVPLWQLQLYFAVAGEGKEWGNKDFYGDIYIQAIDEKMQEGRGDSYYQLSFIKRACDVARLDLTDFFEYSRMLYPIDLWVDDYTCAQMTIMQKDIEEVKKYASKYKKPQTPVMHYITANSVKQYRENLPLKGVAGRGYVISDGKASGRPIDGDLNSTIKGKYMVVDASIWENAVAFETYVDKDLAKVTFVGAGSNDVKSTVVHLPEGYTSVMAVGSDGSRMEVLK